MRVVGLDQNTYLNASNVRNGESSFACFTAKDVTYRRCERARGGGGREGLVIEEKSGDAGVGLGVSGCVLSGVLIPAIFN